MPIGPFPISLLRKPRIQRLAKEGGWVALGQIGSALGLLVGMRLLTEFVPPAVFGKTALYLGIAALVYGVFCTPPLQALLRFYPEAEQNNYLYELRRQIVRYFVSIVGIVSVIFMVVGGIIAYLSIVSFFGCFLLAMLLCIDVAKGLGTNLLNAARHQKPMALWNIMDSWGRPLAALVLVAAFGATVESVLAGYVAASVLSWSLFKVVNRSNDGVSPPAHVTKSLKSDFLKYSLPLAPLAVVGWITAMGDRYIIGGVLGPAEVGIYAAAYGLISRPFLLAGGIIEQTLRPVYFESVSQSRGDAQKIFNVWLITTVVICACGLLAVALLKDIIAFYLLAEKYRGAASLFPWIAAGYSLVTISYVYEKTSYAYKNTRYVFFTQAVGAVACVLVTVPLAFSYGLKGVAMAVPVYFGVQLVVAVVTSRRMLAKL